MSEAQNNREHIREQLVQWRNDLIDLSKRNGLLNFRHNKVSTFEILSPSWQIITERLGDGKALEFFLPDLDESILSEEPETEELDSAFLENANRPNQNGLYLPIDELEIERIAISNGKLPTEFELMTNKEDNSSISRSLSSLDRVSGQLFMDKGLWVLYLAVGLLNWVWPKDLASDRVVSPLILIPVTLQRESPAESFKLRRTDGDSVLNPILAVKLEKDLGFAMPDFDPNSDTDFDTFFDELESMASGRGWRVERRVVVSRFTFAKEAMYRDLVENEESIIEHEIIAAIAENSFEDSSGPVFEPVSQEQLDEKAPPEQLVNILDADSSQLQCIVAARSGQSFIMDGPPGTGKSQTIANIIAELLYLGKTVLFVSEKAAALDVVYSRLKEAGLADYVLELHSHKATRKEVAMSLGAGLDQFPKPAEGMPEIELKTLLQRRRELSAYADAMNMVRHPLGLTVYSAIGRISNIDGEKIPVAPQISTIDRGLEAEEFARLIAIAESLSRNWKPVEDGANFLWRELGDVEKLIRRQPTLTGEINTAKEQLDLLESLWEAGSEECGFWTKRSLSGARKLAELLEHLSAKPDYVNPDWLSNNDFDPVTVLLSQLRELSARYLETASQLSQAFPDWESMDPAKNDLFAAAASTIKVLDAGITLSDNQTSEVLRRTLKVIEENSGGFANWSEISTRLIEVLGVQDKDPSLSRALEIGQLYLLSSSPHKPEANWLNRSSLRELQDIISLLRKSVAEYLELKTELDSVFSEKVIDLNLSTLVPRFTALYKGIGKLRSTYREDRKTLSTATKTGVVTEQAIALLPKALQLQQLASRIGQTELKNAQLLGTHYFQGVDTDFGQLDEALRTAERAISLAGNSVDEYVLAQRIGYGTESDRTLHALATNLVENLSRLKEAVLASEFDLKTVTSSLSLMDLANRWSSVRHPLEELIEGFATVERGAIAPVSLPVCQQALEQRAILEAITTSISRFDEEAKMCFGKYYSGASTDFGAIDSALRWAKTLVFITEGPLNAHQLRALLNCALPPDELAASIQNWSKSLDQLCSYFQETRAEGLREYFEDSFEDARELLDQLRASISEILIWNSFQNASITLKEAGLEPVVSFAVEQRVPSSEVVKVIERSILASWLEDVLANDQRFKYQHSSDRDEFVRNFRDLDRRVVTASASRVMQACNNRRPKTNVGAPSLIRREAEKKNRHMPVRDLIAKTTPVTQAIKPCFMMSPLSVSQFLPSERMFDVVIFDEASQVRPGDAVNCIYRGKQLIIAGDQKQLPPTSFFAGSGSDDSDVYEEGQLEDYESILDHCKGSGALPSLSLKWHYRSQHEDLISFSNYSFYDGRLITFPSSLVTGDDVGIELFRVNGIYRRSGARDNLIEADKVVERILFHARTNPSLSLGVVAFSEAQASAIDSRLEVARKNAPDLDEYFSSDRLRGVFVKNLESVQGDERDVIIFSIGYGPDEHGKFTMDFGPINKPGGQRRLNVAITRARRRIEIVSSIGAEDFSDTPNEGVRHFRRYMDFTERGIQALAMDLSSSEGDVESPFEEEVIRVLRSHGHDVVPQVGTAGYRIDLGVRHPDKAGRFVLGIECDGAMYHSSKVARDRDRLRQQVLEGLGWRLYRIWGTSWYRDRENEIKRLLDAVESAIQGGPLGLPIPKAPESTTELEYEQCVFSAVPEWVKPYQVAHVEVARDQIGMDRASSLPEMKRLILQIVAIEGPLHQDLVLRRLLKAWGIKRSGQNIKHNFATAVIQLIWSGEIIRREEFLYTAKTKEVSVRIPVAGEENSRRGPLQITREELGHAIMNLVDDAQAIQRDQLLAEVARIFGWQRKGSEVTRVLESVIDELAEAGRISEKEGRIQVM
ncbi:DUF3320 domain-containing protein [Acidithrix ferrooxidans]|nr:DUF3320 domain-containing protein [Acidithrix ferrooxidans]